MYIAHAIYGETGDRMDRDTNYDTHIYLLSRRDPHKRCYINCQSRKEVETNIRNGHQKVR